MAISVLEICNMALGHIFRPPIQSLDDNNSREAKECKRQYPTLRDLTLAAFPWGFATKQATLALLTDEPYGDWEYAYAYPSDCITIRKIYNIAGDDEPIEYELAAAPSLTYRMILTSYPEAELVYTARVTDPNMFDPIFAVALSWRLAADLSVALKGSPDVQQAAYRMFEQVLSSAQQRSAREQYKKESNESDFSRSRL
jgi:hypothetical protein